MRLILFKTPGLLSLRLGLRRIDSLRVRRRLYALLATADPLFGRDCNAFAGTVQCATVGGSRRWAIAVRPSKFYGRWQAGVPCKLPRVDLSDLRPQHELRSTRRGHGRARHVR